MKTSVYIPVIILFLISKQLAAQQRHALSAKDAVTYALKNNNQVKNAQLDVNIQEQTNKEITAAAYPQIKGTANSSYYPNISVEEPMPAWYFFFVWS